MLFIKMVYNELVKILKRKIVYIFLIFAIISLVASCIVVDVKRKKDLKGNVFVNYISSENDLKNSIANAKYELEINQNTLSEYDKKVKNKEIELNTYIIENGVENFYNAQYKGKVKNDIMNHYKQFLALDEVKDKEEYERSKEKIDKLMQIFEGGSFEEYVQYCIADIEEQYKNKQISESTYEYKIKEQREILKYELGKYDDLNNSWKEFMRMYISKQKTALHQRIYARENFVYVDDKYYKKIEDNILLAEYRLENNIAPYFNEESKQFDINSYSRYTYNNFANSLSVICVGILIVLLASSSISDEISKGTIKFSLIAPYSRVKLLAAKIVALAIITVVAVFIVSQISVLIGNIVFGSHTNEYIYAKNGDIKVLGTYGYETLQYLLRVPELVIYMLIGITLSSLTKNTPVSIIITVIMFIGMPRVIDTLYSIFTSYGNRDLTDIVRSITFANFNISDLILPVEKYVIGISKQDLTAISVDYASFSMGITAILLLITVFDSFRKKQI